MPALKSDKSVRWGLGAQIERLRLDLWDSLPIPRWSRWLARWLLSNHKFRIGAVAIITDESGKVLFFHYPYVHPYPWGLPATVVRQFDIEESLRTRIGEESGFWINPIDPENLLTVYQPYPRVLEFVFYATIQNGIFRPSPDVADYRFFRLDELPKEVGPYPRRILKTVVDGNGAKEFPQGQFRFRGYWKFNIDRARDDLYFERSGNGTTKVDNNTDGSINATTKEPAFDIEADMAAEQDSVSQPSEQVEKPEDTDWRESEYLRDIRPEALTSTEEQAITTVVEEIWNNEELDLDLRWTVNRALDLFITWGDLGVPIEQLKELYLGTDNPEKMVDNLIDTLNSGLAKLQGPRFTITLVSDNRGISKVGTKALLVPPYYFNLEIEQIKSRLKK